MQEEKKENVYEETVGTEQGENEGSRVETDAVRQGSAVPEKFASVDALVRAYESLQAEFTRRSQRLRELEKATENLESRKEKKAESGAEKLRKNLSMRKKEAKAFDEFIADTGASFSEKRLEKPEREELSPTAFDVVGLEEKGEGFGVGEALDNTGADAPSGLKSEPMQSVDGARVSAATGNFENLSADELFERANRDENVRLRIIGEYLASIRKPNAPLAMGGVGTLTAPPKKIMSIGDAGAMALSYFQKPLEN